LSTVSGGRFRAGGAAPWLLAFCAARDYLSRDAAQSPESSMTSTPIESAPIVTIFGGSGFVGRYVAQAMARRGWRVRVAVRRPNEALFVKPYGVVGQVVPIQANIRDEASCRRAVEGATAVVYCVGVLFESGRNTFSATQAEGPAWWRGWRRRRARRALRWCRPSAPTRPRLRSMRAPRRRARRACARRFPAR